jgi:hypothetical protein
MATNSSENLKYSDPITTCKYVVCALEILGAYLIGAVAKMRRCRAKEGTILAFARNVLVWCIYRVGEPM